MIRSLALFSFAAILVSVLCAPLILMYSGELVVGGHYTVGPGETLKEDVSFYFAQVTIEDGASVDGHVFLYSSTLDLGGSVTEDIHAFESDLTLRESARVNGEIDERDFIHWTLLLPAAAKLP
jgi:hypothetical protein